MRGTTAIKKNERSNNETDNIIARQKPPFHENEAAAELIKQGVGDEYTLSAFYSRLAESAENDEEKQILRSLYLDTIKHEKLLQKVYNIMTGDNSYTISQNIPLSINKRQSYQTAIFKELENAKYYRCVYLAVQNQQIREILFEIITDKQFNIGRINCIISLLI